MVFWMESLPNQKETSNKKDNANGDLKTDGEFEKKEKEKEDKFKNYIMD